RSRKSTRELWLQGFLTSAANPKAVVFFAALFPQFIRSEGSFVTQFAVLSVTYLVIDGLFLLGYGAGAAFIATRLRGNAAGVADRIGALFLIGAGCLLGLKTLRDSS
ncbi:MAG: LysE family transporter, partial [Pseudomonadota bacterium]